MGFQHGVVSAAHPLAAKAGVEVLKRDGNAVDAAITTALVLGTVTPAFCGIGGGGFALIWLARENRAVFVDYRERAPMRATENMFKVTEKGEVSRNENSVGYRAIAVPGTVAGHSLMSEKYGRLKAGRLLEPAVRHAREGFLVSEAMADAWSSSYHKLKQFENSRTAYLNRGRPFKQGKKIHLRELANSLSWIAKNGPTEFYRGSLRRRIVEDMESNDGLVTGQDLEDFTPTIREPVRGSYHDYEVISAPPPSSGGAIIIEALNILENFRLKDREPQSPHTLHLIAEALTRGFINCRSQICDPAFGQIAVERLTSKAFARELATGIRPDLASTRIEPSNLDDNPASNTSHISVIDSEKNMVAVTESVECYFGSGVVVPETGIILNDTMHDFDPRPGRPNSVAPKKIPMSSMSPTFILKDGRPFLALGSAGSTRIVSSVLQTLLGVLEFGLSLKEAVSSPRIHVQGNLIQAERNIAKKTIGELRRNGHEVEVRRTGKLYFGGIHAAMVGRDGMFEGAADPRRDGVAFGY